MDRHCIQQREEKSRSAFAEPVACGRLPQNTSTLSVFCGAYRQSVEPQFRAIDAKLQSNLADRFARNINGVDVFVEPHRMGVAIVSYYCDKNLRKRNIQVSLCRDRNDYKHLQMKTLALITLYLWEQWQGSSGF